MSEDPELQRLKRERLLRLQKMQALRQQQATKQAKKLDPAKILEKVFVGRAWEVFYAAKRQYPQIADQILRELAELVEKGRLKGQVNGEQLFWLFRELGLDVRLETKIQVLERGELKSIADKLRGD